MFAGQTGTKLLKRSFTLAGHRTSVALEPEFWSAINAIATAHHRSLLEIVMAVDTDRLPGQNLASALRLFTLKHARF